MDNPKQIDPMAPPAHGAALRRRAIQVHVPAEPEPRGPIWTYPGDGTASDIHAPPEELETLRDKLHTKRHLLGEWPSTAICGNDILSSVLYSSGLVAEKAGKLAPIPLIMVSVVLYFFRFIYEEVVTAIPLNGGSYNVLLNTTSKRLAAFGATLGILCYLATGVVSATSAINYINREIELPLLGSIIVLLFIFAILNIIGISESSIVALVMFLHHIVVLSVLSVASLIHVIKNPEVFKENMKTDLPPVDFAGNIIESNVAAAIFFGFGAAMLGVTGFESSAQFVEEQQPGVFRKTLRNMWGFATVFNAILAVLALGVLPLDLIYKEKETVLGEMAMVAAGKWLETWVAIDACIVLSGAVLTSYVGITGLCMRLASDRVLPSFLLKTNKWRGTHHGIILLYFIVASSLVLILDADTSTIGGVYTYAFLGLMALFSFGCMLLKAKRAEIPRDVHAPWWTCIMGFLFVVLGIFSNLLGDPKVLMYFSLYTIGVSSVMTVMLERVQILKVLLAIMKSLCPSRRPRATSSDESEYNGIQTPAIDEHESRTGARGGRTITKAIMDINEAPIVFFCKHPDMTIINKAILYVRKNEQTHNLRIVHVEHTGESMEAGDAQAVRDEFENITALFNHVYPKLKIDFVSMRGEFEPALVLWLAETMKVPVNLMFITQPGDKEVHKVAALGVRVITA
ncbi:hypothetical protein ATCC90586_002677 [Pythium insidiosum]|nr:hypothetical protein ATCC90586_002677 [Pythium insidiosum]